MTAGSVERSAPIEGVKALARRWAPRTVARVGRARRELAVRGDAVACPVCGRRFGGWLTPADEPWREVCAGCYSEARHRAMWLWLPTTDLLARPHRLLYFAPEPHIQEQLRALPNLDYVSVDISSPLADRTVDITELPFADRSFDVVICSHVLEHVPDDAKALGELHRVLAPGGWALLLVPYRADVDTDEDVGASPEERVRRFGQADHVRAYGRDFPDRIRSAGFRLHEERIVDRFDPSVARYFGLYDDEVFFVGHRD